ncbi:MAG TPA: PQQ-binding-like beta-propeller repeat protein [Gemmataceae bacterium]
MRFPWVPAIALLLACGGAAAAENWPAWRGPTGQGVSSEKDVPLKWSATENVRWKLPLPEPGNSTPIVWGDRVFITQSLDKGARRAVLCIDRAGGKVLWQRDVPYEGEEPKHATNTYCAASPVTDGERVVASHGSAGMVCYDFEGNELWRKDLGPMLHVWGNASSPILYENLAILWAGPGERQFLVALDKKTGEEVWRHDEPGGKFGNSNREWIGSWATPVVVNVAGRDELILPVPKKLKAFDPKTGKELWSCDGLTDLAYNSPVCSADGIVVAMSGFHGAALAVRAGGSGDVTATHRLWHHPRRNPQRIGSAVIAGEHAYLINASGEAQCFELKTGADVWEKEKLPGTFWSSAVLVGERIYVTSQDGETVVLAAGTKAPQILARDPLKETTRASIAVSGGDIFIRTYKHLWCIGGK